MSKAILKALGDELIAQGHDRMTVRRALGNVTDEEAVEAFADILQWATDVVEDAVEPDEGDGEELAA